MKQLGVLFHLLFILVGTQWNSSASDNNQFIGFDNLFDLKMETRLLSSDEVPLYQASASFVSPQHIYLSGLFEGKIYIFDREGRLIRSLGRKGNGPGEFSMPYGIAVDQHGNVYANDRMGSRIQVFSPSFEYLRTLKVRGNFEWICIRRNKDTESLVLIGNGFDGKNNCMANAYTMDGKLKQSFGKVSMVPDINAYDGTLDQIGNLYLANVEDTTVDVFSPEGNRLREIRLQSPAFVPLDKSALPSDLPMRTKAYTRLKKEQPYTQILKLVAQGEYLFVFLLRHNFPEAKGKMTLDIYTLKGGLVMSGISPKGGFINHTGNRFFFTEDYKESDDAEYTVAEYELRMDRLQAIQPIR